MMIELKLSWEKMLPFLSFWMSCRVEEKEREIEKNISCNQYISWLAFKARACTEIDFEGDKKKEKRNKKTTFLACKDWTINLVVVVVVVGLEISVNKVCLSQRCVKKWWSLSTLLIEYRWIDQEANRAPARVNILSFIHLGPCVNYHLGTGGSVALYICFRLDLIIFLVH